MNKNRITKKRSSSNEDQPLLPGFVEPDAVSPVESSAASNSESGKSVSNQRSLFDTESISVQRNWDFIDQKPEIHHKHPRRTPLYSPAKRTSGRRQTQQKLLAFEALTLAHSRLNPAVDTKPYLKDRSSDGIKVVSLADGSIVPLAQTIRELKEMLSLEGLNEATVQYREPQIKVVTKAILANGGSIIEADTGAGKTVTMSMILESYRSQNQTCLVLVPTVSLVSQVANDFRTFLTIDPDQVCEISSRTTTKGKRTKLYQNSKHRIYVSTPQSLPSDIENKLFPVDQIGAVFIDEVHHAVGNDVNIKLAHIFHEHGSDVYGFSASPVPKAGRAYLELLKERLGIIHHFRFDSPEVRRNEKVIPVTLDEPFVAIREYLNTTVQETAGDLLYHLRQFPGIQKHFRSKCFRQRQAMFVMPPATVLSDLCGVRSKGMIDKAIQGLDANVAAGQLSPERKEELEATRMDLLMAKSRVASFGELRTLDESISVFGLSTFLGYGCERLWEVKYPPSGRDKEVALFKRHVYKNPHIKEALRVASRFLGSPHQILLDAKKGTSGWKQLQKSVFSDELLPYRDLLETRDEFLQQCRQFLLELDYCDHPKETIAISEMGKALDGPFQMSGLIFVDRTMTADFHAARQNRQHPHLNAVSLIGKTHLKGPRRHEEVTNLELLRNGASRLGVGTRRMEEGHHIPAVDKILIWSPSPEAIRNVQQKGRAGRSGKQISEIIYVMTEGTSDVIRYHTGKRNRQKIKRQNGMG